MPSSWKLTAFARKPVIEAALGAHGESVDWDPEIIVSGFEVAPDKPGDWRLDAYIPRKPNDRDRKTVAALFKGAPPKITSEKLPDTDWVTESQKGVAPIRAGNFFVHTPDFPPSNEKIVRSFCIPASQAFGTGQHETTAGCLAMLSEMKARGVVSRNLADIGTGTGLLAFAAMHLWPRAQATASDIDPVCLDVILHNMEKNSIAAGGGCGELTPVIGDGLDDPLLEARAPYDLLIANILTAPLIDLAPDFAAAVAPKASVVLAGLLEPQEANVRRAYRKAGFRLAMRLINGDWSILWLRKRNAR